MDSDKRDRFQAAFERGQKGEVSSFNAWLEEHGFEPERVDIQYITQYYRENPEEVPNHQNQIEEIAEYIGFFSSRDTSFHLPVVGVTGVGKSQVLHTISDLLSSVAPEIPVRTYEAEEFGESGEELDQYLDEVIDELRELDRAVVLVDDCHAYSRSTHVLGRIENLVDNCLIVSTWTPERWRMQMEEIDEAVSVTQEVRLAPLSRRHTIQGLEKAVEIMSEGKQSLSDGILQQISKACHGIPLLANQLLIETLRESFHKNIQLGAEEAVGAALEKLNLRNAKERIYDLSDQKISLLKHILLAYDPRGRRPMELVELLDRDKSTISYHLQDLASDNVVSSTKRGRQAFYRVHPSLQPLIQLRSSQEGEFHA